MTDTRLTLEELLHEFPISQLGYALVSAGLPGGGSKGDRVQRLIEAGRQRQVPAGSILQFFKAESLRKVCVQFNLKAATKAEMVHLLVAVLRRDERELRQAPALKKGNRKGTRFLRS